MSDSNAGAEGAHKFSLTGTPPSVPGDARFSVDVRRVDPDEPGSSFAPEGPDVDTFPSVPDPTNVQQVAFTPGEPGETSSFFPEDQTAPPARSQAVPLLP
jgi:hypothetical protein